MINSRRNQAVSAQEKRSEPGFLICRRPPVRTGTAGRPSSGRFRLRSWRFSMVRAAAAPSNDRNATRDTITAAFIDRPSGTQEIMQQWRRRTPSLRRTSVRCKESLCLFNTSADSDRSIGTARYACPKLPQAIPVLANWSATICRMIARRRHSGNA